MHCILYQIYELNIMTLSGAVVLKNEGVNAAAPGCHSTESIGHGQMYVFQVIY